MNLALKIMSVSHKLRTLEDLFFNGHKLMKYEFNTLAVITNVLLQKDVIYASDIAGINGMSLSAVSRLLNNMENKNLISRSIDSKDRRNIIICITENGQQIFDEFCKSMNAFFDKIFDQLTDTERPAYNEISHKLLNIIDNELSISVQRIEEAKKND